jgi:nucleoside-diphosphate-sugar epimerase
MSIKVIVTGASGMVGEGVMHEALNHPAVDEVLVIGRKTCGTTHPKLKEIIISDFFDLSAVTPLLKDYDACYFCLGVSSVGMKKDDYYRITYSLTMHFAETYSSQNPDAVFCYVSGTGTDGTEQGMISWARVKGKTENDLMKLPFKAVYNFRPGFMNPTEGLKNSLKYYKYLNWFYPIGRSMFKNTFMALSELGLAMINITLQGSDKHILSVIDIKEIAGKKVSL